MRVVPLVIAIVIGLVAGTAIVFDVLSTGQAALITGGLLLGWILLTYAITTIQAKRFNAECVAAMDLIASGDFEQAERVWAPYTSGLTMPNLVAVSARHNIAWTKLRRGELRQAIDGFLANEQQHLRWLRTNKLDSVSALDRALAHALLNELDQARHALAEAGMRSTRAHAMYPVIKAFVDAVIACRDDRAAWAAEHLAKHWSEYEGLATSDVVRPLQIVRAFAAKTEPVKPAYPDEFAFLAVAWPEMKAFLAST
jgi:hypothetical protein